MDVDVMVIRGEGHAALRAELDRQGPLHPAERDTLLQAADALLFDEQDAEQRSAAAVQMCETLVSTGRRSERETGRLLDALAQCGAPRPVNA
jgi:hypothetical protein